MIFDFDSKNIILFTHNNIQYKKNCLKHYNIYKVYDFSEAKYIIETIKNQVIYINKINFIFIFWYDVEEIDNYNKVLHFIVSNNIQNFLIMDQSNFYQFQNNLLINELQEKKIDAFNPIIKINNFKIYNFIYNSDYFFEIGDSLLPSFFNDYSMVDEGPFEYGKVICNNGDVVFDCGANIGIFSAIALSKGCEVHAFEPNSDAFKLLTSNMDLYSGNKVYLYNTGLSDTICEKDFFITRNTLYSSYIMPQKNATIVKLKVTTIDEYVKRNNICNVDFIKADIEGAERFMLMGASETININQSFQYVFTTLKMTHPI